MLNHLTTEQQHPDSVAIDAWGAREIVELMNREDAQVAVAVGTQAAAIAAAVDRIVDRLRRGGRLLYLGAGTSGRLGVLDAAECSPTFNTPPGLVVGIIAGGPEALTRAVEGAEDHADRAVQDLRSHALSERDALVGIATSGRTPYVMGGMAFARRIGAVTIGLSCNHDSALAEVAELMITPVVGPEVLSGSTRLKAGTATKMVLNMLTTASMIRLGKTYGNLLVDLQATNTKLTARARRIVAVLANVSETEAETVLAQCDGQVKTAILVHRGRVAPQQARQWLAETNGHLREALQRNCPPESPEPDPPNAPGVAPQVAGRRGEKQA
jgi:N-acetylmuramic acid 6-phosphate etherase